MDRRCRPRLNAQQMPALVESFVAVPVGQEAVVADADEAARERVDQETAKATEAADR